MNKYRRFSRQAQRRLRKQKMCSQKRAFESAGDARQPGNDIYECPYCHKWHRTGAVAKLAAQLLKRSGNA
jgi:hypothetical protein